MAIDSIHVEDKSDPFVQLELNYSIKLCTEAPGPPSVTV